MALLGATGRMGASLLKVLSHDSRFVLVGASGGAQSLHEGVDVATRAGLPPCGVKLTSDLSKVLAFAQVAIDFSHASALPAHLDACVRAGVSLVIGTTGLDETSLRRLDEASRCIALLHAPNMNLGVAVLTRLVREAAALLPADYDVEIIEAHHRYKKDAPSGTALALGAAVAQGRGGDHDTLAVRNRAMVGGERAPGTIGYAVLRAGDTVGEHTVWLAGSGERLELKHVATDRATFARGALAAAFFLATQKPGLYALSDVLNSSGHNTRARLSPQT